MREKTVDVPGRRISWTAVIAGAIAALAFSFLLHVFNTGVGLISLDTDSLLALSIGAFIWFIICGFLSMFPAGYLAGKLARGGEGSKFGGMLHGFLAWALALVLTLLLASNFVGQFFVGTSQVMSQPGGRHAGYLLERAGAEAERRGETRAEQRIEEAATNVGSAALGIFFILLIGAASAIYGGYVGSRSTKFEY